MEYSAFKNLIWQNAYWTVNKKIAREIWLEEAIFLQDMIDKYWYFLERNEVIEIDWNKYFYNTSSNIEEDTTLSYKVQKRCIKKLVELWCISYKLYWVPAKLHFTIHINKIILLIQSSIAQKSKLDLPKSQTNKNKQIRINNNISSKEDTTKIVDVSEKIIYWSKDIAQVIEKVREWCLKHGVLYQSDSKETFFAKHLLSKKFENDVLKVLWKWLYEFIDWVLRISTQIKWWFVVNNTRTMYQDGVKNINKWKQQNTTHIKTERPLYIAK